VIGGIVGLALIILLGWCIVSRRKKDEFDGDFDPEHISAVRRGRQDLLPELPPGAAEVTPFRYEQQPGGFPHAMAQVPPNVYRTPPSPAPPTSPVYGVGALAAYPPQNRHSLSLSANSFSSPRSESDDLSLPNPYGSVYDAPVTAMSSVSGQSQPIVSQPRSTKEREAFGHRSNMAYPSGSSHNGSQARLMLASPMDDDSSSQVYVHRDGGQYKGATTPGSEIPPTYDSISPTERR
jgi:hypothetical protein